MTELHLVVPSWLLAVAAVLATARLLVDWRLKYWTKRATVERKASNELRRKEQMDRAFGRAPRPTL